MTEEKISDLISLIDDDELNLVYGEVRALVASFLCSILEYAVTLVDGFKKSAGYRHADSSRDGLVRDVFICCVYLLLLLISIELFWVGVRWES